MPHTPHSKSNATLMLIYIIAIYTMTMSIGFCPAHTATGATKYKLSKIALVILSISNLFLVNPHGHTHE